MTWTKLSDDFTDDTWTLSDQAHRLHVDGLVWSNRKLLDLKIPKDDIRRFKNPESIGELLVDGWWEDKGSHYLILHHARYQRLREAVINQQVANKENRAKRGQATAEPREQKKVVFTSSNDSLDDSTNERDGTGRALYGKGSEKEETQFVDMGTGEVFDDEPVVEPVKESAPSVAQGSNSESTPRRYESVVVDGVRKRQRVA